MLLISKRQTRVKVTFCHIDPHRTERKIHGGNREMIIIKRTEFNKEEIVEATCKDYEYILLVLKTELRNLTNFFSVLALISRARV